MIILLLPIYIFLNMNLLRTQMFNFIQLYVQDTETMLLGFKSKQGQKLTIKKSGILLILMTFEFIEYQMSNAETREQS